MLVTLATLEHSEGIRAIYNHEVEAEVSTFDLVPRTATEQRAWVEAHGGVYPAVVALDESAAVAGFGSLSAYRSRPAYGTTVEDSVYVDRTKRGQGIGQALLEDLLSRAGQHGFHAVIGRIVGGNDGSVRLHQRCGFEVVGVEREVGRKLGRWLDVVVVERLL